MREGAESLDIPEIGHMADDTRGNTPLNTLIHEALAEEDLETRALETAEPEHIQAARLRLESIDFSEWGDEVSPEQWAKLAMVAVLHSTHKYTWIQISQIMGVHRKTVHAWRSEDGGRPYAKAQRLVKDARIGHIASLALVAIEDVLTTGDTKDKLRAATFALERLEGSFLDPKYKLKPKKDDGDDTDPLDSLSVDELRKLADILGDKTLDLKTLIKVAKEQGRVIDMKS